MPTITKAKALKNQALAPKGWTYDWKHYVIWGEHQLTRSILQDDGSRIEATVCWRELYTTKTNEYGCKWTVETGTYAAELHVARWKWSTTGCWVSNGLGKSVRIGTREYSKRVYKELCKQAARITDEIILGTWENQPELQLAL